MLIVKPFQTDLLTIILRTFTILIENAESNDQSQVVLESGGQNPTGWKTVLKVGWRRKLTQLFSIINISHFQDMAQV